MSRCKSCDAILKSSELVARNSTTGEFEDLCRRCNHSGHDTGVIRDFNTEKPIAYVNEVFHIQMDDLKGGLSSPEEMANIIRAGGTIKTLPLY